MRGIYAYGFEQPSSIQKKAIPSMLKNKDIIAQAQSGTGKTGAFTIGTLGQINTESKNIQGLILSPTRELSKQIYDVLSNIGKNDDWITNAIIWLVEHRLKKMLMS